MTVTTPSLVRPFLDAAPAAVRPGARGDPDLDRRLWALVAEGRAAWPELRDSTRATLVAFVGAPA